MASIHESIDTSIELKEKYQMLLFEPGLLFRYRKKWTGFLWAIRLYNKYKAGEVVKGESIKYIDQIKKYDGELAESVQSVLSIVTGDSEVFPELLNELKKGRQYFVSYISTHYSGLIEKAKSVSPKNPKLSRQLVDLFTAISGHEIDYLMRYKGDCEDWLHYAVEYNIAFFISRANLFLNGGLDNSRRDQFKGLYRDFGDEKLRGEMVKSDGVRNLWFYNQQLRYLYSLIDICIKAQASKDWAGFYGKKGFWTEFDKYAKTFEKSYGNIDFAERLLDEKKKTGNELPQFWGGVWQKSPYQIQDQQMLDRQGILYIVNGGVIYTLTQDGVLPRLLKDMRSKEYLIRKCINPAAAALIKIFEERENELQAARSQSARDLIKLLLGSEFKGNIQRLLKKILKKKRAALLKKLKEEVSELEKALLKSFPQYLDYLREFSDVTRKIDPDLIDKFLDRTYRLAMENLKFALGHVTGNRFLQDLRTGALVMGADVAAQEAWLKRLRVLNCDHLSEEDLRSMGLLLIKARAISEKLKSIYGSIILKISSDYTISIDGAKKLDWKNIANKNFEVRFINKAIARLI